MNIDATSANFDSAPTHVEGEYRHLLQQVPNPHGSVDLQYVAAITKCKFSHTGPHASLCMDSGSRIARVENSDLGQ